ncbi:MAG: cytochrome c maturation protein CcmE [Acidobacteriota bacterium]
MNKNLKFGLLAAIILGTLGWLAAGGVEQTATYYKEIAEIQKMGPTSVDKRLRVGGDIKANSIIRKSGQVHFTLIQNEQQLEVVYTGADPLPDTFKDGSQAVADGKLASDGVFHATKVQAKCASKYEAKPTGSVTRG